MKLFKQIREYIPDTWEGPVMIVSSVVVGFGLTAITDLNIFLLIPVGVIGYSIYAYFNK